MSLSDDMFDLDDYFDRQVKVSKDKVEARSMRRAYNRVVMSHADMERKEMKTDPVMAAIATILHEFKVNRGFDEEG